MRSQSAIFVTVLLLTFLTEISAQSLTFCKSVGKEGQAINAAREFSLSNGGVSLTILFQLGTARPASVSYDIYKIEKGKEVFSTTLTQQIVPAKNWLSKELTLYEAGSYKVYVYDPKDQLLAQSLFTIIP